VAIRDKSMATVLFGTSIDFSPLKHLSTKNESSNLVSCDWTGKNLYILNRDTTKLLTAATPVEANSLVNYGTTAGRTTASPLDR
jgi:hypothetical protein